MLIGLIDNGKHANEYVLSEYAIKTENILVSACTTDIVMNHWFSLNSEI